MWGVIGSGRGKNLKRERSGARRCASCNGLQERAVACTWMRRVSLTLALENQVAVADGGV